MIVNGLERDYIVHDDENIKGFFGPYRWASNFHVAEIYMNGLKFPASENGYMYTKLHPDCFKEGWMMTIDGELHTYKSLLRKLQTCKPHEAKKLGRQIPIRDDWERVKYDMMAQAVFDKYFRHMDLRAKLLSTYPKYIEETNHWNDTTWGVCNGVGTNWLGKITMNVREFWGKQYPDLLGKPTGSVTPLL